MIEIMNKIKRVKIVPVIELEKAEDALPLAEVLVTNGLPMVEISFKSVAAEESIRLIKKSFPEICIGAGYLLNIESIQRAVDAGADFFVSPRFNPTTAIYAEQNGLLMMPGVTNPSLVEQAIEIGHTNLKISPAEITGGTHMIKAFGAVYPEVCFLPTGGITTETILDYLSLPNVCACGGSWMVKKELIQSQQWDVIAALVKKVVTKVQNIK